jgi:hypothetical protein
MNNDISLTSLPVVAFALALPEQAPWQRQLVERIRTSGLCETVLLDPHAPAEKSAQERILTAIIDLSGRLDASLHHHPTEGIWRLCGERGVQLGDKDHGLASIASGMGARVCLVANNGGKDILIDHAAVYVEPYETISPQRFYSMAESLVLAALREIRALGQLEARAVWKPRGARPAFLQKKKWQMHRRVTYLTRRLKKILLVEQWMLGIIDMPMAEALHSEVLSIRWIGDRVPSYYWADPFGVPGCKEEIYCEEYDVKSGLGRIVKLKLDGDVVRGRPEPVDLGLPGHLSYPYLFRHADALYCVAESAQSRRCVLNRRNEQGTWTQVAVLLEHTPVADPTIFEHGGYFWLAYTDVSMGAFDNLCLLYASELVGPWHAHPQNPVKIDHLSARPAGSVIKDRDGQLMRVAQVCKSAYGQAIAVNRIRHCTPEFYREEVVRIVDPNGDSMNPHGLHTMTEWGDRTLVDGKRHAINLSVLVRKIASRFTSAHHLRWR